MRNSVYLKVLFLIAVCFTLVTPALAETSTSAGVTFRLRQETWDNVDDFKSVDSGTVNSNDTNFWRLRTTPWFKIDVDKKYAGYVRLANEARYYMDSVSSKNRLGSNKDELLFDNLYVKVAGIADMIDITYGRQDLLGAFGEGFLIMDGTPGDGSRTFYFDAVRATLKFSETWNADIVYITNHSIDDRLPVAHSGAQRTLNASDEQGAILYARGKVGALILEPYYIWKKEFTSPELDLNTIGARAVLAFGSGWNIKGEAAFQNGEYDGGRDREGLGYYIYLGRKYENVSLKPSFELGYTFLSGDDPATAKDEAWNPLWSRYPWVSELYSLSYASETSIAAYWTNLKMYRAAFKFSLPNNSGLDVAYAYMQADQSAPYKPIPAYAAIFSNSGTTRGDLIQVKLSHTFSQTLTGYVTMEEFMPGDYYADTNQDNATFVRWELQWKI